MSKKKKQRQGSRPEKPQSLHKVSAAFAADADGYFYQLDPNSTIAKVLVAAREDQEIPKSLVLKAIEKLEDCRDQELFYAAKDGEMDATPSKAVTRMLRSLKQSLTVTASGEATRLHIPETATFAQFAALKVPGGRDLYSSMRLPKLVAALGEDCDQVEQIQNLWQQRNEIDKSKNYPFTDKERSSVLRWHLRGLSLDAAVRKVRVDHEITQNYHSSHA